MIINPVFSKSGKKNRIPFKKIKQKNQTQTFYTQETQTSNFF